MKKRVAAALLVLAMVVFSAAQPRWIGVTYEKIATG
jgi:hypothetical protein